MSDTNMANLATIRDQTLSAVIILSAFGLSGGLAAGLVLLAWYAIGNTEITIQRTRDIVLVIIPVITLVIGSAFGFIAGRKMNGVLTVPQQPQTEGGSTR